MIWDIEYSRLRQKIISELLMALTICLSPFIILIHLLFNEHERSINFFGITYTHLYTDNQSLIWHILNFLIPIILLTIIFYTSSKIWRGYLAPLIVLYTLSIIHVFIPDTSFADFLTSAESIIISFIILELLLIESPTTSKTFKNRTFDITRNEIIYELLTKSQWKMNDEIEQIISSKKSISKFHYLCKLYHLHNFIETFSKTKLGIDREENARGKNRIDSFSRLVLLALTIAFLLVSLYPSLKNFSILGIEIGNYGFPTAGTFLWYFFQKVVMLGVLIVWYFSSRAWWKWAIFTPVLVYSYQLLDIFFGGVQLEETQNLITSPFVLLSMVLIFFIAAVMQKRNKFQKYYSLVQEELQKGIYDLGDLNKI